MRTRSERPKQKKPTARLRVENSRTGWQRFHDLADLPFEQFCHHVETGLRELGLPERMRREYLDFLNAALPPQYPWVWETLQTYGAWPLPDHWIPGAARLLIVYHALRAEARQSLSAVSLRFRMAWEKRKEGLIDIVRGDGVREPWVQEAISELRRKQVEGSPQEQRWATQVLQRVGKALGAKGEGGIKKLTPAIARQIRTAYEEQLAFCQRFRTESEHRLTTRKGRQELAQLLGMTLDEITQTHEEEWLLTPSAWARQRTATKLGCPEERVRQALLKTSPKKQV